MHKKVKHLLKKFSSSLAIEILAGIIVGVVALYFGLGQAKVETHTIETIEKPVVIEKQVITEKPVTPTIDCTYYDIGKEFRWRMPTFVDEWQRSCIADGGTYIENSHEVSCSNLGRLIDCDDITVQTGMQLCSFLKAEPECDSSGGHSACLCE